jgi:hypothetical protein
VVAEGKDDNLCPTSSPVPVLEWRRGGVHIGSFPVAPDALLGIKLEGSRDDEAGANAVGDAEMTPRAPGLVVLFWLKGGEVIVGGECPGRSPVKTCRSLPLLLYRGGDEATGDTDTECGERPDRAGGAGGLWPRGPRRVLLNWPL